MLAAARLGKWVKARYRAELHEIRERYAEFELIGDPEIREPSDCWTYFNPWRNEGRATVKETLYTLRGRLGDTWEQNG